MRTSIEFISKAIVIFWIYFLLGTNFAYAQNVNFNIQSEILNETRRIEVHLPENYDENNKIGYSVIYMLDAGNNDAQVAKTVERLSEEGIMPNVIVVAIENIRRLYDFTPPHAKFEGKKGNGEKFLDFIKLELIKEVNGRFMVNDNKVFMGHSAGGLFLSYLMSQSPGLFDGYFFFSPAISPSNKEFFRSMSISFRNAPKLPEFVYVSVGSDEEKWFKESYKYFIDYLEKQAPSKIRLKFEITDMAKHMDNPEKSMESALKFAWKKSNSVLSLK